MPKNPSFTWELGKSAFLGGRYESFKAGDPNQKDYKVQDLTSAEPMTSQRAHRRETLLKSVDDLARKIEGNDQIATYDEFHQRAADMILSSDARNAFAIEKEDVKLRDRYGRTTAGQSCLLARRLVEAGVRYVTVNYGGWDHHGKIYEALDSRICRVRSSGWHADFRFARPRNLERNARGGDGGIWSFTEDQQRCGRDRWGPAASLLLAGAGVKPGFVLGKTDKQGGHAIQRPVAPADVCYTILDSLGIDPRMQIKTPDGRPIEVLDQGENISELFA